MAAPNKEAQTIPLEDILVTRSVIAKLKIAGNHYREQLALTNTTDASVGGFEDRMNYFYYLSEYLQYDFLGRTVCLMPEDSGYLREADAILEELGIDLSGIDIPA